LGSGHNSKTYMAWVCFLACCEHLFDSDYRGDSGAQRHVRGKYKTIFASQAAPKRKTGSLALLDSDEEWPSIERSAWLMHLLTRLLSPHRNFICFFKTVASMGGLRNRSYSVGGDKSAHALRLKVVYEVEGADRSLLEGHGSLESKPRGSKQSPTAGAAAVAAAAATATATATAGAAAAASAFGAGSAAASGICTPRAASTPSRRSAKSQNKFDPSSTCSVSSKENIAPRSVNVNVSRGSGSGTGVGHSSRSGAIKRCAAQNARSRIAVNALDVAAKSTYDSTSEVGWTCAAAAASSVYMPVHGLAAANASSVPQADAIFTQSFSNLPPDQQLHLVTTVKEQLEQQSARKQQQQQQQQQFLQLRPGDVVPASPASKRRRSAELLEVPARPVADSHKITAGNHNMGSASLFGTSHSAPCFLNWPQAHHVQPSFQAPAVASSMSVPNLAGPYGAGPYGVGDVDFDWDFHSDHDDQIIVDELSALEPTSLIFTSTAHLE